MKLAKFVAASVIIQVGLAAYAQELQSLKFGHQVQPRAYAWIGADGKMLSPWKTAQPGGGTIAGSSLLLYDNFEADANGVPTDDCYGHDCALSDPTGRWFFGTFFTDNQRQFVTDDMVVGPGADGVSATRIQLAFYWGPCPDEPQDPGESFRDTPVFIGIMTYDDVSTDCNGFDCDGDGTPDCPAINPLGTGLVIELQDELRCRDPDGGYSVLDFSLTRNGEPPLPMPPDGAGGYSIILARDYDSDTGVFTLAHSAQMMLWGNTDLKVDNPSDQEVQYWVDVNGDQQFAVPSECFTAFSIHCPNALGTMVAFHGAPGDPGFMRCTGEFVPGECDDPCDMNCDGVVNAFDIEPFLGILFDGDPPCAPCTGDTNGDGNVDAFDIEPFLACLFP